MRQFYDNMYVVISTSELCVDSVALSPVEMLVDLLFVSCELSESSSDSSACCSGSSEGIHWQVGHVHIAAVNKMAAKK